MLCDLKSVGSVNSKTNNGFIPVIFCHTWLVLIHEIEYYRFFGETEGNWTVFFSVEWFKRILIEQENFVFLNYFWAGEAIFFFNFWTGVPFPKAILPRAILLKAIPPKPPSLKWPNNFLRGSGSKQFTSLNDYWLKVCRLYWLSIHGDIPQAWGSRVFARCYLTVCGSLGPFGTVCDSL